MNLEFEQQIGRAIFRESHDAIAIVNPRGLSLLDVNPSFQKLTGRRRKDLLGSLLTDHLIAESDGKVLGTVLRACESGSYLGGQDGCCLKAIAGNTVPVQTSVSEAWTGTESASLLILRDLSRARKAEQRELSRREILELITRGHPLPMILEAITSFVEEDSPGWYASVMLLGEGGRRLYVAAAPSLPEIYRRAIDGVEIGPGVGSCGTAAFRNVRVIVEDIESDPLWTPYQEVARLSGMAACWSDPIRSRTGEVLGTFAIYHPSPCRPTEKELASIEDSAHLVSIAIERTRAEEALRESQNILRMVLDNIPQGVFWKDRNSRYLGCNQSVAKAFGLSDPREIIGQDDSWLAGLTPDQAAFFVQKDREVMASDRPQMGIVEEASLPDGRRVWLETNKLPLHDSTGRVVGILGTWQDITERKRAEEALRESEARYRAIFDHAVEGFFQSTPEGRFLNVNPALARIYGFDRPEQVVHGIEDIGSEVFASRERRDEFQRLMESEGAVRGFEFEIIRRDGSRTWVSECARVVRDAGGRLLWYEGTVEDISDRKRVEEALIQSERKYRDLVETTNDLIWAVDLEGRLTFLNRLGAQSVYGREPEEMIGRSFSDFSPAESVDRDLLVLERIKQGESIFQYETCQVRQDGTRVVLSANAIPVRNEAGEVVGARGTAIDITARKRAEEHIRRLAADMEAILQAFPDLYFWADYDGTIRRFHAGMPTAVPPNEFLNRRFQDVLPTEVGQLIVQSIRRAVDQGVVAEAEYSLADERGVRWFDARFVCLGSLRQVLVIVRDVTERHQAEAERRKLESQLQHTQKLESLGILAGGIAHDFNNLLTSILGYSDLALLELPPQSPARAMIEEAISGARQAAELTKQMLAYSGKGRFVVEPVDLSRLVRELTRLLQVSISKKCTISYVLAEGLPSVEADVSQMRQVIMNLIMNAAEAMEQSGGVISVTTGVQNCTEADLAEGYLEARLPAGRYCFLEVADTGCGMSPETRARIFDPFFTTKFTGRGLGLSAVLGIVRGHQGAIICQSEPGRGTRFRVYFPTVHARARNPASAERLQESWRGEGLALVVDDEESVRGLARTMLETLGFRVLTARDGLEGLDVFRKHAHEIRFVLLDMTMPNLDGRETFRAMGQIRPDVKTILSSGYNEQTARDRFEGPSPAAFIQKPYRFEELRSLLRKLLDRPSGTTAEAGTSGVLRGGTIA